MKIDHIHFYVKDARSSRDWFINRMGFQALASSASRHTRTTVVRSGAVYIVLSSPLTSTSPVAQFLRMHPPGVADIAFVVSDLESVVERAVANGAKVLQPIGQQQLAQGSWKWAKIAAWGSLTHTLSEPLRDSDAANVSYYADTLVKRNVVQPVREAKLPPEWSANVSRGSNTSLLPVFSDSQVTVESFSPTWHSGFFTGIDHVVLNVASGDLEKALSWYEQVLGFQRQQSFMIQTDQSGLRSQVMVHPTSGVQFPINEPTSANSQIQEFLDVNQGSGVQHIALQTPQIVEAIAQLRHLGLSFLPIPRTYYTQLRTRHHGVHLSTAELEEISAQEILVDWQDESPQSLLLQTFTHPIFEKPTFFFELIERRQEAQGFGEGNFRALFEAIEREQLKRGSLEFN